MAQVILNLEIDEILRAFTTGAKNEGFRLLLQKGLNAMLERESSEQLGAKRYERTEERTDSRNGVRTRELKTRIGRLTLSVPRHRNQPFRTMLFENYSRSEQALLTTMTTMVLEGVSTRKIARITEELCGTSFSKSAVSEICKSLDAYVDEFRNRPLTDSYPFLTVDATYFKVRENHRVTARALMIAFAVNSKGLREVVGFKAYPNESTETWTDFLSGLRQRGLTDPRMIISDAHGGIVAAAGRVFPTLPWQRCQFHFAGNITAKAPAKYQAGLSSELTEMFNCRTIGEARKKRDQILSDYKDVAESAMLCLDEGFESAMTVMALPAGLRRFCRTSNHIERLNRELKRRSSVIGIFPNEESLVRTMGAVLIEESHQRQSGRALFSPKTFKEFMTPEVIKTLIEIANEQQRVMAAWRPSPAVPRKANLHTNPDLTSWPGSSLVLDIKGENWALTAGWRKTELGHIVLRFDPSDASGSGCRFNPVEEIRLDSLEAIQDVQNMALMLVDPDGKGLEDHWTKAAFGFFSGLILHCCIVTKAEKGRTATLNDITLMMANEDETTEDLLNDMLETEHQELYMEFASASLTQEEKENIGSAFHVFIASSAREMLSKSDR